jgi:hypothetical protein
MSQDDWARAGLGDCLPSLNRWMMVGLKKEKKALGLPQDVAFDAASMTFSSLPYRSVLDVPERRDRLLNHLYLRCR